MAPTKQRSNEDRDWKGLEELASVVVDCGFKVHDRLGPGLLESAYSKIFAEVLSRRGLLVEREVPIAISIDAIRAEDAFRADLLINDVLLIELKSTEAIAPVHLKQVQTDLRLMQLPLGFLMNFGAATFQA